MFAGTVKERIMSLQNKSPSQGKSMSMPALGNIAGGSLRENSFGTISDRRKTSSAGYAGHNRPEGQERREEDMARYFAREDVDPLCHAFDGKIAVHPGAGGELFNGERARAELEKKLDTPREGKSVAYIHVPFCETHCLYCGFYNKAYRPGESAAYADTLDRELTLWADRPAQAQGPVHAVYLGGGTPTALEADDLRRILRNVRSRLPLANDCEITVEGRLTNFDERKMEACLDGGANRFSLGVQSFNTKIRQNMGRLCPREELLKRIEKLRSYDQAVIVVDLIYGFPYQDMTAWLDDIATAQSINLDGADCYQLNTYKGTPLARAIENGALPAGADVAERARMFAAAVEAMQNTFWHRLSISHWARTTRERNLYNQYVKGRAHCLAFGPGGGGSLDGLFYMNQSDIAAWREAVNAGQKPLAMVMLPEPGWKLYKAVTEGMERGVLNMAELEAESGEALREICHPLFSQWERAGLVSRQDTFLTLTVAGQFWQVNLNQLLIDYLKHRSGQLCRAC